MSDRHSIFALWIFAGAAAALVWIVWRRDASPVEAPASESTSSTSSTSSNAVTIERLGTTINVPYMQ